MSEAKRQENRESGTRKKKRETTLNLRLLNKSRLPITLEPAMYPGKPVL